jgi:hypothetical protein
MKGFGLKYRILSFILFIACDPNSANQESSGGDQVDALMSGEERSGETPGGETSGGETSGGETSGGETSGGETSGGETSGGETSGGEATGGTLIPNDECLTPEDYFAQVAWPQVFKESCAGCHNTNSVGSSTRLVFTNLEEETNRQDYEQVAELIHDQIDGLPTILLKPTRTHPQGHGGGLVLSMGDERLDILVNLAERELGTRNSCGALIEGRSPLDLFPEESSCGELMPGRRLLRRLSHQEYQYTIFDLLGLDIDAKASFVADPSLHGFDNPPEELNVSSLLVNQYREMAEQLGESVSLDSLLPCSISEGNIQCAQRFIVNFGQRAYRRPLTHTEVDQYLDIYRLVVTQECFEQGVRWIIIAMLQSPHFLYRSELGWREGDRFKLSAYELASELSYLVWQSMPDEELFELATQGELLNPEVVDTQLQRLLADPRSVRTAQYFVERWLHLDRLMQVTRDSIIYAALYFELREMMLTETRLFVEDLWLSSSSLSRLFSSNYSWINAELAEYYGLELGEPHPEALGFHRAEVGITRPAGIFTQGSFLTTHAAPTSSSPILRGVTLREQLLCDHLDPPPEGLEIIPPLFDPTLSTRERFAAHTEDALCASCHQLIDPLGFAFENYDGIGRYRVVEGSEGMEIDIDSSGILNLENGTNVEFSGVDELSSILSENQKVRACYVKQWMRFGIGESEGLDSDCYTAQMLEWFEEDGFSIQSPLSSLINTPHFFSRMGESSELSLPGESYLVKNVDDPNVMIVEPLPTDTENPACGIPPSPEGGSAGISDPRLMVSDREDRWDTGYCRYVTVNNSSDDQIDGWVVQLTIEGSINNAWNIEYSADSGVVNFTPVEWNTTLYPQSSIEFGFCGQL